MIEPVGSVAGAHEHRKDRPALRRILAVGHEAAPCLGCPGKRATLLPIEPAPAAHDPALAGRVPYGESPAFWVAIGVFALNPVATYAIAYLIQRSILMATLFVALALWLFARGLRLRQPLPRRRPR